MSLDGKLRKSISKLLLDFSKILFGGAILALFIDQGNIKVIIPIVIGLAIILAIIGFLLLKIP